MSGALGQARGTPAPSEPEVVHAASPAETNQTCRATAGAGVRSAAVVCRLPADGAPIGRAAGVSRPGSPKGPAAWAGRGWLSGIALGWLAGTALQLHSVDLWPAGAAWSLAAAALSAAALAFGARRTAPHWQGLALVIAAAALGYAAAEWRAGMRLAQALPSHLEGRDIDVIGTISALPRQGPQGWRFVLEVETATLGALPRRGAASGSADPAPPRTPDTQAPGTPVTLPDRLSLAWYRGFDGQSWARAPAEPIVAGDRWRMTVRLRQPHGSLNPHGFDLEQWLFIQDLRASGYVRPGAARLDEAVAHPIERLRQRVRDAIFERVDDARAAGVIAALAVGDQASIDGDDWALFRDTGIAHLMSISGLHVTMFAWLAAALVGVFWRRSRRCMLAVPTPLAARLGGLGLAFAYALVAGWGVPAQRTVLMLAVVAALRSSGLHWPAPLVLLVAAVAVTGLEPWALLQPGFWLSFAAVGLLMVSDLPSDWHVAADPGAAPALGRLRSTVRAALRTQWIASIGLAPLTLIFFQQVSIAGFVANLVAVPLVTLLITPLALSGLLWGGLWEAAATALDGLSALLRLLLAAPGAVWTAAAAPGWAVVAGLAGGAVAVMPLPWRVRLLGLPLVLPLLMPATPRPVAGQFETVAVDVGQGTAVLVRTRHHLLVYDAGPRYSPEADAGQRVLAPLLRARGERAIDLLVLSHGDTDHVGGAESLLEALPVRTSMSSLSEDQPPRARLPDHRPCVAGERWHWDGVAFEVLHPSTQRSPGRPRPNTLSCVLRVRDVHGRRLLLTGDIEAAQEALLVARHGSDLRSEVLLVPHHGSRTSSTPAFLQAVAPEVAVVQAAYRSRFGHPAPEVIERYHAQGIVVARSDRCGAWTWPAGQPPQAAHCERDLRRRFWHWRASEAPGPDGQTR